MSTLDVSDGGGWSSDPALTLGLSVFETLAVTPSGDLLECEAHLARLSRSATWLGAPLPPLSTLRERFAEVAQETSQQRPKSHLTALRYTLSISGRDALTTRFYPMSYVGAERHLTLILSPPSPHLPRFVKHSSRAEWRLAATRECADETLLCDLTPQGHVEFLEADLSGLCALRNGALICPPDDGRRLPSVGVARLSRWAQELGAPVRCQPLFLNEFPQLDALLLCSSLKGVCLVTRLSLADERLSSQWRALPEWSSLLSGPSAALYLQLLAKARLTLGCEP
jgi:branched-subunit amino acid aminotransferase/4-amino-4-deoxychorismate lyase